jgi:hypothetical protein
MASRIKKQHPALKHAGYSATSILPGESAAEFEKLNQEVISELTPNGALEADIVATITHFLWRREHLATFRIAELAQQRMTQIRAAMVPDMGDGEPKTRESVEFEKTFIEKWHAAESQARKELGELYALVEMGDEVTVDRLIRYLHVFERLDAMIDKSLKRLLLIRGLKSMSFASTSVPPERLPGP